jgi:hypothetical protein
MELLPNCLCNAFQHSAWMRKRSVESQHRAWRRKRSEESLACAPSAERLAYPPICLGFRVRARS